MWRRNGSQQQQQQQQQPPPPTSWYPPPPPRSSSSPFMRTNESRPSLPQQQQQGSVQLSDRSVEELRKILSDKEAYENYLHSTEEFRQLDTLRTDLRQSNVSLARLNLNKDSEMAELKNQCTIIRTTELAAALEKFAEVQAREEEILTRSSPAALLKKLQEVGTHADDESEALHRKFLNGELDFSDFTQKYRLQRILYHRRTLMRIAAQASTA